MRPHRLEGHLLAPCSKPPRAGIGHVTRKDNPILCIKQHSDIRQRRMYGSILCSRAVARKENPRRARWLVTFFTWSLLIPFISDQWLSRL